MVGRKNSVPDAATVAHIAIRRRRDKLLPSWLMLVCISDAVVPAFLGRGRVPITAHTNGLSHCETIGARDSFGARCNRVVLVNARAPRFAESSTQRFVGAETGDRMRERCGVVGRHQ